MANYLTDSPASSNLQLWANERDLIELSNDDGEPTESIDETTVTKAIAAAEAMVDSYIGKQYSVPLTGTIDEAVKDASSFLAVYKMRMARDRLNEEWRDAYRDCMAWLKAVSEGDAVITTDSGTTDPTPTSFTYNERKFNRSNFQDW